jgi:hypothetical protein
MQRACVDKMSLCVRNAWSPACNSIFQSNTILTGPPSTQETKLHDAGIAGLDAREH